MSAFPIDAAGSGPAFSTSVRRLARALIGGAPGSSDPEYRAWLALRSPTRAELAAQRARATRLEWQPLFDVLVRRRPGDALDLERTRRALSEQTWTRFTAHEVTAGDDLAGVVRRAKGDLALVVDAGDALAPHALFMIAEAADPETDLVYADEDRLVGGGRASPFFKSGWSPEELRSHPYVGCGAIIRRSLLATALDGAAPVEPVHALWLRLMPSLRRVRHVPDVLVHRRADAPVEGRVAEHAATPAARVAVVVPTRDQAALLDACVSSLEGHSNVAEIELIVVDNASTTEDARALLRGLAQRPRCRVMSWNRPFNWSAVNNAAVGASSAEYLLFLNNDVEAKHPGWLDAMVALASRPEIGLVGAQLLYPDGALQHYGVVIGMTGFAGHLLQGCRPEATARCGPADVDRNCSSVTGACMLVRRDVFERLGGFDERFVLCGSDVALGLRALALGLRNVVTPRARLVHHEARTRGAAVPASDYRVSLEVYEPWLRAGDPYYNPNLSLRDTRARMRLGREDMLAVARGYAR